MASLRRESIALKMVLDEYLRVLKSHIREDSDSRAGSSSGRNSAKAGCKECVKYSAVLGLPVGASDSEVRHKRRAWAEVLHPDQLGGKSETARAAAEEQLKSINEACEHILTCPYREKAKDHGGGKESSQTPRQSAGETAMRARAGAPHSPPSWSSEERKPARQEHGYGVRSEQDLIGDIDATRRKVEESTRKTEELLAELKRQSLYR
jgi:curved DNA-binding protein CbpA